MKKSIQNQKGSVASQIVLLVVLIVAGIVVFGLRNSLQNSLKNPNSSASNGVTLTGTSMSSASTTSALDSNSLTYGVLIATSTFKQSDIIPMTVVITNKVDTNTVFTFKNGCQASYVVGGFDYLEHTTCLPNPSTFTVASRGSVNLAITHNPSVFKLPVGTYTVKAEVIGYGDVSFPVTITQ